MGTGESTCHSLPLFHGMTFRKKKISSQTVTRTTTNSSNARITNCFCFSVFVNQPWGYRAGWSAGRLAAWTPLADSSSLSTFHPAVAECYLRSCVSLHPGPILHAWSSRTSGLWKSQGNKGILCPRSLLSLPHSFYWKALPHFLLITWKQWF